MMKFITGNINKFIEVQSIFPDIEQLDIDLPEIQSLDPQEIVAFKLKAALDHVSGNFIVEDTSLYLDGLHGLPGPLIRWFLKAMGREGLAKVALSSGNDRATAKTIIGYADEIGGVHYFEGSISGRIVMPLGETSFGWDPIFQPDGYDVTFAEMGPEEKNRISMRRQASQKLADFLNK
ncbi:MAG: non-canonical purine NTP pyrophosphatase [Candidatus Falkowbacteria bacterium]